MSASIPNQNAGYRRWIPWVAIAVIALLAGTALATLPAFKANQPNQLPFGEYAAYCMAPHGAVFVWADGSVVVLFENGTTYHTTVAHPFNATAYGCQGMVGWSNGGNSP